MLTRVQRGRTHRARETPPAASSRRTHRQAGRRCKARCEDRRARMDRTAMIERVVEIQRMRHARIQHGRLRRRYPPLPQHHLALWRTAPAVRNAHEFSNTRRTAAAQQAPERVEDIVAGGASCGGWQLSKAGANDVLRQCPGWILGHHSVSFSFCWRQPQSIEPLFVVWRNPLWGRTT